MTASAVLTDIPGPLASASLHPSSWTTSSSSGFCQLSGKLRTERTGEPARLSDESLLPGLALELRRI